MDAYDALRTIQTLARVALDSDDEELSAETLADMQRRTLNGIVVVTENALAKAPGVLAGGMKPSNRTDHSRAETVNRMFCPSAL